MSRVTIAAAAVLGPGLPGWEASKGVLSGAEPWQPGEVTLPPPALLAPTERRRTGPVVRLALAVASAAAEASGLVPSTLRPVFASANGDSITVGSILEGLTKPEGFVSPTQFHNSVHNAAAGYWSIATGSGRPATCLGCHDWSFGGALMKAVAECTAEGEPILLSVYDVPLPAPLDQKRSIGSIFGVALVLVPDGSGPRITLRWDADAATRAEPLNPTLRDLALTNPAARSLRLLESLAKGGSDAFDVALLDGCLGVTITA